MTRDIIKRYTNGEITVILSQTSANLLPGQQVTIREAALKSLGVYRATGPLKTTPGAHAFPASTPDCACLECHTSRNDGGPARCQAASSHRREIPCPAFT